MRTSTPRNKLHARYWTTAYPMALIPMMQLIDQVDSDDMGKSTMPALFYFSPDDKVVDPQKMENFIARWRGPKEIMRIDGGDSEDELNHLITGQVVSPSGKTCCRRGNQMASSHQPGSSPVARHHASQHRRKDDNARSQLFSDLVFD